MTRQEAKEAIKAIMDDNEYPEHNEAYEIAINDIESMDLLSKVTFKFSGEVEE